MQIFKTKRKNNVSFDKDSKRTNKNCQNTIQDDINTMIC